MIHPDSELLYKQAINLQLSKAQLAIAQCEKDNSNYLETTKKSFIEKFNNFLDMIFKNIKKFSFYFELLELFEEYNFVGDIKKRILNEIMCEYSQEPLVWHSFAQRCQRGTKTSVWRFEILMCMKMNCFRFE